LKKNKTLVLCLCALFAALCGALSQLAIPLGQVPITLTHVAIFLAAGLLGRRYATLSVAAFVAMGAIGLPVFAGFSGGMGIIAGPTGGFIFGYIACAWISGLLMARTTAAWHMVLAMVCGMAVTYLPGVLWFVHVMEGYTFTGGLAVCVVPYLPGDAAKMLLCALLIPRLRPVVQRGVLL